MVATESRIWEPPTILLHSIMSAALHRLRNRLSPDFNPDLFVDLQRQLWGRTPCIGRGCSRCLRCRRSRGSATPPPRPAGSSRRKCLQIFLHVSNIFTCSKYFCAVSRNILTVVLCDGAAEGSVGGGVGGHLQELRPRGVVRVDLDTAAVIWRHTATASRVES